MKTNTSQNSLLTQSPIPMVIVAGDGQILEYSDGFYRFFECNKKKRGDALHLFLGELSTAFRHNLKQKDDFIETIEVVSVIGKTRWIRVNAYAIKGNGGCFQLSFDDVTQQKIQYELGKQAQQIARVGSWTVNLIKNTVTWSNVTKEIHELPLDYEPDLETGINFYKEGDSRNRIIEVVSECIETGKAFDEELVLITAKGNERWVRSIGEANRVNGKTIGFSGVFQDIDETKRQQLRYEVLNDRMRVAIGSANIGIWDFDIVNNNLIWNKKMYDLYGVREEDFNGVFEAWEATVHPEDKERANEEVQQAIEGEKDFNTEFRILKGDGSTAFIHAEAKVFYNEDGQPCRMIGANTDVSRIKRQDQRLRQLLNVTEKQNQRLLDFTNIVSHNLRSNSSNISMLAGMLNSELTVDQQKQFIEMIQTSSENLDETIVQLNETVKIQATSHGDLDPIPLSTVFSKVLQSVNALVLDASATIETDLAQNLRVLAVKPYLSSVFLNLLTNSLKYRHPSRPLKIKVKAQASSNQTIVTFTDNGIGIDLQKYGTKVFGMYKTFHNNKDAKGIGLFITKNHMEAMNGCIEVESVVDKGSTFRLYFMNNH
ncbi:PAS domain-containing protein [uncultured Croceitalea sp.]|uniref:PAS domain-containing protein n=1 Tax=uncultured Croceitalea sp. TaxID=1798908 RepID=UPI003305F7AA